MQSTFQKRREDFAERVADALKNGIVPWQKKELPDSPTQSAISNRRHENINALRLMEKCVDNGYKDPRFITASEAKKNGVYVKKGEQGVVLEHWFEGKDGKIHAKGYSVFNVEQLSRKLPDSALEKLSPQKVSQMFKNAGIDLPEGSGVKEYQDAIKKLTVKKAEESGLNQLAHTPELLALRYNIASTMAMREMGIPVEQSEGLPTKSWAQSIKNDPSQLSKAAMDGSLLAGSVMRDMTRSRDAELFQADQQRAEAQKGQELVEANTIPRGLDSNLPNADLSGVQESVIASASKASEQVNSLRASASSIEAGANTSKFTDVRTAAKKQLGSNAIVTNAQPGHTYQGKIIGVMDKTAIQAISDNRAVLHDIRDISSKSNIKIGEVMSLSADDQGYSMVQGIEPEKNAQKHERSREGLKR